MAHKRKRKQPAWLETVQTLTGAAANARMEMEMRGELADTNRKGDKGTFRFENVERGSATYDQPYAVKSAQWKAQA